MEHVNYFVNLVHFKLPVSNETVKILQIQNHSELVMGFLWNKKDIGYWILFTQLILPFSNNSLIFLSKNFISLFDMRISWGNLCCQGDVEVNSNSMPLTLFSTVLSLVNDL